MQAPFSRDISHAGAEPWLLKPIPDLGGHTLQQHYQELAPTDGVAFECRRMVSELIEEAVVYNRTRQRSNVLSLRFEAFAHDFDGTAERVFRFLDSGESTPSLVKAASQFDLQRAGHEALENEAHVSPDHDKAPLRQHLRQDAPLLQLLSSLDALLGYTSEPLAGPVQLCEQVICQATRPPCHRSTPRPSQTDLQVRRQVRALCATTNVRFFQWCTSGRVLRGQIASLPRCGEARPGGMSGVAANLAEQYRTKIAVEAEW